MCAHNLLFYFLFIFEIQVERINFYTTSNKNLFSVKVIPTLPSIKKNEMTTTSEAIPVQNYANECESTTLPLVILFM